jgi:rhodanese-related sulfurtransferase
MALTRHVVLEKMNEKDVVMLNVLSEGDFRKIHIKGSFNLPYAKDPKGFVSKVDELFGRGKFFITHCSGVTCMAGPNAAKALRENGFKAEEYPGGMQDWLDAGYPVEGTEIPLSSAA